MLLTLFGVSVLIFVMLRLVPGNIADILFDAAGLINPAEKAQIEKELGLDLPIPVQYARWIGGLLQGDLGYSFVSEKPTLAEIAPRIPITAKLAGLALAFSIVLGIPLGVISAVRQNSWLDYVLRVVSLSGLSMPAFWLGLLILMAFVAQFGTIPIYTEPPKTLADELLLYSIPAAAVGFRSSALIMRLTRSSMLEVLRQDYIRTARSKGASESRYGDRHRGRLPDGRSHCYGDSLQHSRRRAFSGRSYPLARLPDRPESRHVHCGDRRAGQFHRRPALCGARSPHQIRGLSGTPMAIIDYDAELAQAGGKVESVWSRIRYAVSHHPLGAIGAVIMVLFVFAATFADFLTVYDPLATNSSISLAAPSSAHWLGADFMGRDVYSRIVYGARISLAVGLGSTFLGCTFGVVLGLSSGYLGGWVDLIIQRVVDVVQGLPLLVLALVMAASLGPALDNTIIAISVPLIPYVARVIRSNTLALRELPFVEAARAVGMSELRIAVRHILPNTLAPLIVLATAQLGAAILTEAALSFLGLGIPEPHPSWGRMLSESAAEYVRTAPWLVIFPGVAISLAVFGTNLLGDALRDILDPRLRN